MRMAVPVVLAVAVLALTAGISTAEDRVYLRNGSTLRGEIIRETPAEIVIKVPNLGKIIVDRREILRVEGANRPSDPTGKTPRPDPEDPPVADPIEIPYEEIRAGETVLVILKGRDVGACRLSGRRLVARVEMVGSRRMKLLLDPAAGVLGFSWIPRESIARTVRIEGHAERRIMLVEGMEIGCWVRGKTQDGRAFAGRLERLARMEVLSLSTPRSGTVEEAEVHLGEIREIEAFVRSRKLGETLERLAEGEPVRLTFADPGETVEGRWVGRDAAFYTMVVSEGPEAEPRTRKIFGGLPISGVRTLPKHLRAAFTGLEPGDALTVETVAVEGDQVIRRTVTGNLVTARVETVVLDLAEGREAFPVSGLRRVTRTEPAEAQRRMARLDRSRGAMILSVLPGMSREEATRLLGDEHEGIDVVFEGDEVAKVYCCPPMRGPLFGVELGSEFRKATRDSDLVFDTRIEPVKATGSNVVTLLSHTIRGLVIKLFMSETDVILAMEIARR